MRFFCLATAIDNKQNAIYLTLKRFSVSLTNEIDMEMELDMYNPYMQNMTMIGRNSYLKKYLQNGTTLPDPQPTPICDWSADITKLPDVNWMDIQTYLIDTPSEFTKDSLKARKSLEDHGD